MPTSNPALTVLVEIFCQWNSFLENRLPLNKSTIEIVGFHIKLHMIEEKHYRVGKYSLDTQSETIRLYRVPRIGFESIYGERFDTVKQTLSHVRALQSLRIRSPVVIHHSG